MTMSEPAPQLANKTEGSSGHAQISGHDTVLVSNTTGQDKWSGERSVIGTSAEVTIPEDERPFTELPPRETIPTSQPERKIELTILDTQITQNLVDSSAELGVCNVAEYEAKTRDEKPVSELSSSWKAREIIQQRIVEKNKRDVIESSFCPDTQQPTLDESPPISPLPIETEINNLPQPSEKQVKCLQLQPSTVNERGGVYLKHPAHEALGDSANIVVTGIVLKRIDDFIEQVTNVLARVKKALLPPIDSGFLNDRLEMGLASRNDRLKAVRKRFSILRNDIFCHNSSRSNRTVFDGGGEAMNWLFGFTTANQLTTQYTNFRKLTKHTDFIATKILTPKTDTTRHKHFRACTSFRLDVQRPCELF